MVKQEFIEFDFFSQSFENKKKKIFGGNNFNFITSKNNEGAWSPIINSSAE